MIHVLPRWSFGYLLGKLNQNTRPRDTKSYAGPLDAIKMNSMKTLPTQVFLVSVLLWSVFFFFINEILVLHSSLAALKEKIADGFTFKMIVYILGGFLMAYISRYIKRREKTTKINK